MRTNYPSDDGCVRWLLVASRLLKDLFFFFLTRAGGKEWNSAGLGESLVRVRVGAGVHIFWVGFGGEEVYFQLAFS